MELRKYQARAITDIRAEFSNGFRRVCLCSPCGSGKTVLMAYMAGESARRGMRTMFVVHRRELLQQASNTLAAVGVPHGIIAPGHKQTADAVQIASVQTIARREVAEPNLLIFDETHHALARTWRNVLDRFPEAWVVGLTATPARLGGQGLGDIFERLVMGPSARELIAAGNLAPYKYYAPPVVADLDGLSVKHGDFDAGEAAHRMDRPAIIGNAVEHYKRLADGMQAICYCASIEHSRHTAEAFTAAGVQAEHVDGATPADEREAIMARFRRGETKIMTNVDLFGEGLDVPAMEAVILLRPTASLTLFIQQSMRPMRPQPGKTAVIIDHVGNVMRHGLPDDDREWSLDDKPRKKRKKMALVSVRQCPECYAAHEPQPVCPFCGHEYPVASREILEADGELTEIDRLWVAKQKKREVGQARSVDDLARIAAARGYKQGWIFHMAKLKGLI